MEINNPRGILLMALAFALFAVADTIAKVLLEYYSPLQVVFIRMLGLFLGVNFVMLYNFKWFGKTQHLLKNFPVPMCPIRDFAFLEVFFCFRYLSL